MTNQISTQLSTFNFEQSSIRVVSISNEPWFVAKDVCDTLGIKNPSQALENLDEDERAMFNIGRSKVHGGGGEVNIISESGMYTLILRCRDAVKKGSVPHRFRKWVTAEVLPAIRKTGKYESAVKIEKLSKVHQTAIKDLVLGRAKNLPKDKQAAVIIKQWAALKNHFGVTYKAINDDQFAEAVSLLARLPLEGELIIDDEPKAPAGLTEGESQQLAWDWFALFQCVEFTSNILPALDSIQSKFAPQAHSIVSEYGSMLRRHQPLLQKLTAEFKTGTWEDQNWNRILPTIRDNDLLRPKHRLIRR